MFAESHYNNKDMVLLSLTFTLFYFIHTKQFDKKLFVRVSGCILIWAVLFVVLAPACWGNVIDSFKYLFFSVDFERWHDYVLFDGRMLHRDYTGMPKKYLPIMILLTIPVDILLLTLFGVIMAVTDFVRKKANVWKMRDMELLKSGRLQRIMAGRHS